MILRPAVGIALSPAAGISAARTPVLPAGYAGARRRRLLLLLLLLLTACEHRVPRSDPKFPKDALTFHGAVVRPPVEDAGPPARVAEAATSAEDGQWRMPLKDFAGTRYSGLAEIDTTNVHALRLAWSFDLGLSGGQQATPLVVDNTLYVVTSYPNLLYAFDLTRPGPSVKWVYDPKPARAAQGVACCDIVNRGAVHAGGLIIYGTLDAHAVAVDAASGAEVWRTKLGEIDKGESITMAPLAVGERVIFGNSGGEYGARGWLKALSVASGAVLWTAYSTGSDADVRIGAAFRPHYDKDRGRDLGVMTWPGEQWKVGGGTAWGWISYDPSLDLIYYGTGNAAPWNPAQRRGDNKWAATVFARRPATGEAVWAYQWDPQNVFAWDGVGESTLLDMELHGRPRQVMVRAEKNGFVYVIDRGTGEVLSATPYMHGTFVKDVDTRSGEPIEDLKKKPTTGKVVHGVCPAVPGAKDWEPTAFSPRTGLLYIPANNLCMDVEGIEANYIAGTPYLGATVKMYAGPGGHRGEIVAWDPVRRTKVWSVPEHFVTQSGPLATAGDVVFYGTMDRWLKAVHARDGRELWRFQTATGINAPPITFRGADGKQYVAVLSGPGGWAGAVVSRSLDPRDQTAARGYANAMHDLPEHTGRGGHLYVFALP